MSQVNFGASGAGRPAREVSVHDGSTAYINSLLNEGMHGPAGRSPTGFGPPQDGYYPSTADHGSGSGVSRNTLYKLGIAAAVGFIGWRAGAGKFIRDQIAKTPQAFNTLAKTIGEKFKPKTA